MSPVFGDYRGFPPMFFAVGEHEMLLDDTLAVVDRLQAAGVPVVCERQPGMFHSCVLYKNAIPESRESYGKMKEFIRRLLDKSC